MTKMILMKLHNILAYLGIYSLANKDLLFIIIISMYQNNKKATIHKDNKKMLCVYFPTYKDFSFISMHKGETAKRS